MFTCTVYSEEADIGMAKVTGPCDVAHTAGIANNDVLLLLVIILLILVLLLLLAAVARVLGIIEALLL